MRSGDYALTPATEESTYRVGLHVLRWVCQPRSCLGSTQGLHVTHFHSTDRNFPGPSCSDQTQGSVLASTLCVNSALLCVASSRFSETLPSPSDFAFDCANAALRLCVEWVCTSVNRRAAENTEKYVQIGTLRQSALSTPIAVPHLLFLPTADC